MPAIIIDGHALAAAVREDVRARAAALKEAGRPVRLAAVLTGDSPAGRLYADRQAESAAAVGIDYDLYALPADTPMAEIARLLRRLNESQEVTGIMAHQPLPAGVDPIAVQSLIDPKKDVEGVNPANIGYVVYGQTRIAPAPPRRAWS